MANRISKELAEQIVIPPTTWYVKPVGWLAQQEKFSNHYTGIPVQQELLDSILEEGLHAPMLVLRNWYPITGSQRLRAIRHIMDEDPSHPILDTPVRVARFNQDFWNAFELWPDKEFKSKAKQVYFQMIELAWKSIHFIETDTERMVEFETRGDKLKWQARDGEVSQ